MTAFVACFLLGLPATPRPALDHPPRKIAFASTRDGNLEIYIMNEDFSNQTRMTFRNPEEISPAISPDGGTIAFHSHQDGFPGDVNAMRIDGTGEVDLTEASANLHETRPGWSPDQRRIAYHRDTATDSQIWSMNPDGSDKIQLTNTPNAGNYNPVYSIDGSKILFFSTRDGGNYELYMMNADGSNQVNITNDPELDAEPSFSPDGDRILFNSTRGGSYDIWSMKTDGTDLRHLTNDPAIDWYATYSADGSKILFVSNRSGSYQLYLMNADGTNVVQVTNTAGTNETPQYQPLGVLSRPVAFAVPVGTVTSGSLSSLLYSEDSRITLRPGIVFSTSQPPIQLTADGFLALSDPSQIHLRLEASVNQANLQMAVELYNYTTNAFEQIYTGPAETNDRTLTSHVTTNPSRFVHAGDAAVKARISWKASGPVFSYPWQAKVDWIGFVASP